MKGKIVYAFPGSGKTTISQKYDNMIDLERSYYKHILTPEQEKLSEEERKGIQKADNPEWPQNYFNAIEEALAKYDYVFTSHIGIEYAIDKGHDFWLFYPSLDQKEEYKNRMIERGNAPYFIERMYNKFDTIVTGMMYNPNAAKKVEMKGFLEESFQELGLLNKLNEKAYIKELKESFEKGKNCTIQLQETKLIKKNGKVSFESTQNAGDMVLDAIREVKQVVKKLNIPSAFLPNSDDSKNRSGVLISPKGEAYTDYYGNVEIIRKGEELPKSRNVFSIRDVLLAKESITIYHKDEEEKNPLAFTGGIDFKQDTNELYFRVWEKEGKSPEGYVNRMKEIVSALNVDRATLPFGPGISYIVENKDGKCEVHKKDDYSK